MRGGGMGRGQRGVRAGSFSAALSHPDFARLALCLAGSTAGSWLSNVALLVYVFDRTHSASWVAAATVVRLAPFVLFGPIGGALADRLERRSLMIASDLARGGLMLGLAVAAATSAPPAVALAIAFLSTTAGTPYNPAVGAMTPALVREADLAAANAVVRTIDNTAIVLGPAIGGLLLVVGPPAFTFLANGVSFLGSVIAVSLISVRSRAETVGERPGLGTTVVEGVRALRGGR